MRDALDGVELRFEFGEIETGAKRLKAEVKGCAVIDKIELLLPAEQIGVARGAIKVGDEGIKPDDAVGELGRDGMAGDCRLCRRG